MDPSNLNCMICPGEPRFSDVSHLLTHVSSKAHLSNAFKLQVRSHLEHDAAVTLMEYENWFKTNDLASLLSDRINAKEQKRKRKSSQPNCVDEDYAGPPAKRPRRTSKAKVSLDALNVLNALNAPHTPNAPNTPNAHNSPHSLYASKSPAPADSLPHYLDPRLMEPYPNTGYGLHRLGLSTLSCFAPSNTTPGTSAAQHGNETTDLSVTTKGGFTSFVKTEYPLDGATDESYKPPVTPKARRTRSKKNPKKKIDKDAEAEYPDPPLEFDQEHNEYSPDEVSTGEKEKQDEMTRLKGILWPGMNLFDSATQQMRRRRNQKKDSAIMKLMEATSLLVEPTEQVFSPEGELLAERFISGNVDENEPPLKGETPIPKQRPSRTKKATLRPKDPNRPLRKRTQKEIRKRRDARFEGSQSPRRSDFAKGIQQSYTENSPEFMLSVQAFQRRPRGGLTVFSDPNHQEKEAFRAHQNSRHNHTQGTLTPARLVLDHPANTPKNPGRRCYNEHVQAKENIEPMLSHHGEIDMGFHWDSPLAKRSAVEVPHYPSDFFFVKDEKYEESKYDLQSNPLVAPNLQMGNSLLGDGCYDDFSTGMSGWNIDRAQSSEATISEDDQKELTRLYLNNPPDSNLNDKD